jgi:hypothetical protein
VFFSVHEVLLNSLVTDSSSRLKRGSVSSVDPYCIMLIDGIEVGIMKCFQTADIPVFLHLCVSTNVFITAFAVFANSHEAQLNHSRVEL